MHLRSMRIAANPRAVQWYDRRCVKTPNEERDRTCGIQIAMSNRKVLQRRSKPQAYVAITADATPTNQEDCRRTMTNRMRMTKTKLDRCSTGGDEAKGGMLTNTVRMPQLRTWKAMINGHHILNSQARPLSL